MTGVDTIAGMRRSPLFEGVPDALLGRVAVLSLVREVAEGEVLLSPERQNGHMYLVLSGRLDVRLGEAGVPEAISVATGGTLGEMSIIDGQPASALVAASEHSRVLAIPETVFWELLLSNRRFARNLARLQTARMRAANARGVQRMRDHLELEHLQRELQIARSIQTGMLPGRGALFAGRGDVEVHGLMDPAHEIGGDLYDVFFVESRRLVAVIGDVSGKGIPAALFMARVIAQLRLVAISDAAPDAVLSRLNALLCEHNEAGMFVTLACLTLDLDTGALIYSNAGHNPVAVIGPSRCGFLPAPKGLVAGLMTGISYGAVRETIAPGETVLLYTDGVVEALDGHRQVFGDAGLLDVLAGAGPDDAGALVTRIRRRVDEFSAGQPQSDDITMLAIRRPH